MARSRLHKRYRKHRRNPGDGPKANPPLMQDVFEWIGPGFAGFAATRFLSHVAATQIAKHKPSLGKHAGALASVGSFLAAWFLANKWKPIAKYQMPLVVGAGLAAAQSLLQLYVPKLGILVSDASPHVGLIAQEKRRLQNGGIRPEDLTPVDDDPNEYTYNDEFDAGRMDNVQTRADVRAATTAQPAPEDDLSELDLDDAAGQAQNMGIFGGAN